MRPSRSIRKPDPVPRPTWIITVAGSTRLAISTVLALVGGGGTGPRVTPGRVGAEGLAVVAAEGAVWRARIAPPKPAAVPITSAVRAATAITDPERARRPVRPEGKIAVVAEKGALPGGPAACAGSPLGGGQLTEPKVGMGL